MIWITLKQNIRINIKKKHDTKLKRRRHPKRTSKDEILKKHNEILKTTDMKTVCKEEDARNETARKRLRRNIEEAIMTKTKPVIWQQIASKQKHFKKQQERDHEQKGRDSEKHKWKTRNQIVIKKKHKQNKRGRDYVEKHNN